MKKKPQIIPVYIKTCYHSVVYMIIDIKIVFFIVLLTPVSDVFLPSLLLCCVSVVSQPGVRVVFGTVLFQDEATLWRRTDVKISCNTSNTVLRYTLSYFYQVTSNW